MRPSSEELCPSYVGDKRLSLRRIESGTVEAFSLSRISVDYAATLPSGAVPPFEFIVQGPSPQSYVRKVYNKPPPALFFRPREGGAHLILLREFAHNKWWGSLTIDVNGQQLERDHRR